MNFPNTPLSQPDRARPRADRAGRRDHRPRAVRLLGHGERLHRQRRQRRRRLAGIAHQAGRQADQHQRRSMLNTKSNYQDFQRFQAVDVDDGGRRRSDAAGADRGGEAGAADRRARRRSRSAAQSHEEGLERRARAHARGGGLAWDASPISTARLSTEIWAQIKDHDWSLGRRRPATVSGWPSRLWHDGQALSVTSAGPGGYGHRLRRAGRGRRRARQPRARAASRSTSSPTAT